METDNRFGVRKQVKNFDIESIQDTTDELAQGSSGQDLPADVEDIMLTEDICSDGDDENDDEAANPEEDEDDELQSIAE